MTAAKVVTVFCLVWLHQPEWHQAHTHILRTNNQKTGWGFKFMSFFLSFFFQHDITSMSEACGSVTCTLGEDRTAGRPAFRRTGCCQVTLSQSSTAADPSRRRCWLLTTHTTMSPVNPPLYGCPALMRHLIGRDELFAVAAWGPAPLYNSHCPHLIRSPLPLVCVYMVCVCTCSVSICTPYLKPPLSICVHLADWD